MKMPILLSKQHTCYKKYIALLLPNNDGFFISGCGGGNNKRNTCRIFLDRLEKFAYFR